MLKTAFFAALVATSLPALADTPATTKLAADVRVSETATRLAPADGGAYIELAQVYRRAGRISDAVMAYRAALARDNVMMVTPNGGSIWSHEVARAALAHVPQLAAR